MLKKIIQASIVILCSASIFGCSMSHQPTTCDQLRRQWIYQTTNVNIEASSTTSAQQDALREKLRAMNCM